MINDITISLDKEKRQVQAWHNETMIGQITVPPIEFDWGYDTIIPMAGISGVKTDEAYRGYGIADRMMQKAIEYAREQDFAVGGVSTLCYLPARHLYTKHNYVYLFTIYCYKKNIENAKAVSLPEGITIRPYTPGDEKGIIDVWNAVYTDRGSFGGKKQDVNAWLNRRKELLDKDAESVWVAVSHNWIVGYAEYYYHWDGKPNCETAVLNTPEKTSIIHGLLSNLERAMNNAGFKQIAFYPSPGHEALIQAFHVAGYTKSPTFVFQVAIFDLDKLLAALQPLFLKRLKNSTIESWPHVLRITMDDQTAEVTLPGGNKNETIELTGSYESIVRILCGRKSAWEEYLRSHVSINSPIDKDTQPILDTLSGQYSMYHPMWQRW